MKKLKRAALILLFLLLPFKGAYAAGSSLLLTMSRGEVAVGDLVFVTFSVSSPSQAMNAVSGTVPVPANLEFKGISRQDSIVNFWTQEPQIVAGKIQFEGIVLNPGYKGNAGKLFVATFAAKRAGSVQLNFADGSVLANDGLGSNILDKLGSVAFSVRSGPSSPVAVVGRGAGSEEYVALLPVITDYSQSVESKDAVYIKGKGEPNALTKLSFNDLSVKSLGERFVLSMQSKKKTLEDAVVKNDQNGIFEYVTPSNLIAGVYNATPFLIDAASNEEKPGPGVQLLVNDSKMVHWLVVMINVLALLVPIVGLAVIVFFIPWYSWLRMRIIKRKMGLEEEKVIVNEHLLERQDKISDQRVSAVTDK